MTARAPRFAASLAASLAACNGHHPPFPYAPPDAPVDALELPTTLDAAPGAVAVTVTQLGKPVPGLAVYFQAADSSLVLAAATDAAGTASTVLAAGGYVTVIEPPDPGTGATRLATFAATQPGDDLHIDLLPTGPIDATAFAIAVPVNVAATTYEIDTSCGQLHADATGTATGALVGCGGAADLIAFARDGSGETIGSLYAPDVPLAQPAMVSGDYAPLVSTMFSYTGVPANRTTVTTLQKLATARGELYVPAATSEPVSAGKADGALDMPMTGATAITVSEALPADGDIGEQMIFDWAPWSAAYSLDVAAALLPPLVASPVYDVATRTVSWGEGSGGAAPSMSRARIRAFRDAIPGGTAWTWAIVAPHGGASVAFPRFPTGSFDYTPTAGDSPTADDLAILSVPGGYGAARGHGFDEVPRVVNRLATGATGRLVVQTLYVPSM